MRCEKCERLSSERGTMQISIKNPRTRMKIVKELCSDCRGEYDRRIWETTLEFLPTLAAIPI